MNLLKHPATLLLSVALALGFGQWFRDAALVMDFWGELYLSLLSMCVIPILLSSVTVSITRIIRNIEYRAYLKKMVGVFIVLTFSVSLFATLVAVLAGPGKLDEQSIALLNSLISDNKVTVDLVMTLAPGSGEEEVQTSVVEQLADSMVPKNIFFSMASDASLQVLVFSTLFGLSLGLLQNERSSTLIDVLEEVYSSFTNLVHWLLYLLPFALFAMIAHQSALFGADLFLAMTNFILVSVVTLLTISFLSVLGMAFTLRVSFGLTLRAMQEVIVVALTTRNSLACIPMAIEALKDKLYLDSGLTHLVTPLGINIGRFGCAAYYAIAAVFVADLYQVEITLVVIAIIVLTSVLAGFASAGTTGVLTLSLLVLVLQPLGLPLEAVLVLLIAVDTIIDPFRTLAIVMPNCFAVAVLSPRQPDPSDCIEDGAEVVVAVKGGLS